MPNVKLKSAEFNWIGRVAPSVNMTFVMATVPVKTIQDTFKREVMLGASAAARRRSRSIRRWSPM